jgi:hypothetical protein
MARAEKPEAEKSAVVPPNWRIKRRREDFFMSLYFHKDNEVASGKKKGSVETPPVAYKNNSKRKTLIYGFSTQVLSID